VIAGTALLSYFVFAGLDPAIQKPPKGGVSLRNNTLTTVPSKGLLRSETALTRLLDARIKSGQDE